MIQFKLLTGVRDVVFTFSTSLHNSLKAFLDESADDEIRRITFNLQSDNFFNLSKHQVNPALKSTLELGRKYTPYLKINLKRELQKFDTETFSIVSTLVRGFYKCAATSNVKGLFRNFLNQLKNDPVKSYRETRKSFHHRLSRVNCRFKGEDNQTFLSCFSLHPS